MISPADKDKINDLPIVDVISKVVELKKDGSEYAGFSPFQKESTRSFKVSDSKNLWKCFSSGKGGKGAVSFFMELEKISWYEAVLHVAKLMNVTLENVEIKEVKPEFSKRSLKDDETPGTKSFKFKDFTPAELKIIGPRINENHCQEYNLHSVEIFTICRANEALEIRSTPEYPIFVFDFGDWKKVYQPKAEKEYRFSYVGVKPARFAFGMNVIEKKFKERKAMMEDEDYTSKDKDPRLESAFIMSGGSDGLNLRSFEKYPIWYNSEQEHLDWDDYMKLKKWVKEIYYIADLDIAGRKQAIKLGLKYLDIHLVWLPNALQSLRDERGNFCKDFKNYVQKYYKPENQNSFKNSLDKLIENSHPMQFWTAYFNNKKTDYYISNTRLYNFLTLLGFGRYEHENLKEGYIYIKKEGSIVRVMEPYQIANFVHNFLEQRQMPTDLRDYVYKTPQLGEKSLSNLPKLTIDFTVADRNTQHFFFAEKVWRITKDGVEEFRQGEIDRFIWEDKIIDFDKPQLAPEPFKISEDVHGDLDIEIIEKDNMFLNYLINTSRIHWRKELEDSFDGKKKEEELEYFRNNRFNIAGDNLSDDEKHEQKLHLINKIYSLGYMLHQYKNESKAWCVFAMDNKISDQGESHGGSGKSICYSYLNNILKRRVVLKGRDPKLTQNDFIYSSVTEDTDFILIDDAHQYLNFDFFFSEITGSLIVNPKNNQSFEIPFSKAPKFVITSNFTPRDIGPSTARRLLYTVFSDFYHFNKDNYYKQERTVADDFEGRNLFKDFTADDWNKYYVLKAYCVRFYLNHKTKINPPMDNVTKRNLITEMTMSFKDWADVFFDTKENLPGSSQEEFKYQNVFFSKDDAFTDFKNKYQMKNWTPQRFKKAMTAYCQFMGWVFNPIEQGVKDGRIMKKFNGVTQEVIYIKTFGDTPQDIEVMKTSIDDAMKFNQELDMPDENEY